MDKKLVTDLYFMDTRSKLVEIAAVLDRLQRATGEREDDFRWNCLRDCLPILSDPQPDKARRILERMSDPTVEPVLHAGQKGASGAWPGYPDKGP